MRNTNKVLNRETKRLILRQWKAEDYVPFAALNADPLVMQYFPSPLTTAESNAMADKIQSLIAKKGWGFWAVEIKESGNFIGFVGLHEPQSDLPFRPCVEVGWRLDKAYWQKGYATEAAQEALRLGFEELGLDKIYAFTSLLNKPSENVMKRLGMVDTKQNFAHPDVPKDSPLKEHVLYEITYNLWNVAHEEY